MAHTDSSKSHVVIAAGLYPPDVGGPATYAAMIATLLPEYGYAVTVVPFHEVRSYPKLVRHLVYGWKLWRETKSRATLLALDGVSVGGPALLVSRMRRTPLLVRLGGDFAWEQGQQRFGVEDSLDDFTKTSKKNYRWPVRLLAWLQRKVASSACSVIVPSTYLARVVRQWPGIKHQNVAVMYSVLHPLPTGAPALAHDGFTILTACRLVRWKGVMELLEVLVALPAETHLRIAGDGPERLALEERVRALGLGERVTFLGQLDRQALRAEKVAADVFVLNTSYEGLSHELLEVMDLNTPIVTTPVGGNPELITHEETGLLVSPNDTEAIAAAIKRLRNEPALVNRLTTAAKARTTDFTPEASLQSLTRLLHRYGA